MGEMFRVVDLGYNIPYELEQEKAGVRDQLIHSININRMPIVARDTTLNETHFLLQGTHVLWEEGGAEDVTQMQCDKGHNKVPWETKTGVSNLIWDKIE